MNNDKLQSDIVGSTTVIMLGSQHNFDYVDAITGIRVTAFSTVYHFPIHPTPAS